MEKSFDAGGTGVANNKHVVPPGVAVEELKNYDYNAKQLVSSCPPAVQNVITRCSRGSTIGMALYDKLINAVVNDAKRSFLGKWKDEEVVGVMDLFRDDFAEIGMKVVLCKRSSESGTFRWLEFIDVNRAPNYVAQYDVGNYSGQCIKTIYKTLRFPNGVAVEELKRMKSRKALGESIPVYVETMMKSKDLMVEYQSFVDHLIESGGKSSGDKFWRSSWDLKSLIEICAAHTLQFEKKGVTVYVCNKQEYVHHGNSGHTEYFRWLEFVDRTVQPNYQPQREADVSSEKCIIS